ncbi:STAS/SEC14 domain-containing protein [Alkalihalobacillus deserti]|uniref:STAS/SEC14 domain-containing protein n=1 Tax=Alkalihalobacillus deserti TaxID=2879466 RepID=UPI001D156DF0|nr:STAS/SEC14 domain-containing protein [Alkalihalobacillus deserti]
MIAIKPNNLETVIEVVVNGKITKKEIEDFEKDFKEKKEKHEKTNLLLAVHETDYSVKGLIEDLKFSARHWEEFHKIAVFSDKKWIELSAKISEYIPGVQVHHFDFGEREKALDWFER